MTLRNADSAFTPDASVVTCILVYAQTSINNSNYATMALSGTDMVITATTVNLNSADTANNYWDVDHTFTVNI